MHNHAFVNDPQLDYTYCLFSKYAIFKIRKQDYKTAITSQNDQAPLTETLTLLFQNGAVCTGVLSRKADDPAVSEPSESSYMSLVIMRLTFDP